MDQTILAQPVWYDRDSVVWCAGHTGFYDRRLVPCACCTGVTIEDVVSQMLRQKTGCEVCRLHGCYDRSRVFVEFVQVLRQGTCVVVQVVLVSCRERVVWLQVVRVSRRKACCCACCTGVTTEDLLCAVQVIRKFRQRLYV